MNSINSECFQFLDLCNILNNKNTDMVRWIAEFNKFNSYRENIPDSSIEYQFIKWKSQSNDWSNNSPQQTQEPPSKKLAIENITKPILLQSLYQTQTTTIYSEITTEK